MNSGAAYSVAKNTTVMMASQLVTWASSFVLMMFLPRYLGALEYGRLYLAMSITSIIHLLIEFGGTYFVPKEVARNREAASAIVVNSLVLRLTLWLLSFVIALLFLFFADYNTPIVVLVLVLTIAKLWEGAGGVLSYFYRGIERMEVPALAAIVDRLSLMSMGISALLLGAKSLGVGLIMSLSSFLGVLVNALYFRRLFPRLPKPEWDVVRTYVRRSFPYFLWSIFAVVYFRIDAVVLSMMTPELVVGWYGTAYRFFDILMFFPSIFTAAILPVLARFWGREERHLLGTTARGLVVMLGASIPIGISVLAYSKEIIAFFFGLPEFSGSVIVLKIISAGIVLVYVDFFLGTTLLAFDKQKSLAWIALGAIPLNIGLNLWLIPLAQTSLLNGGIGAAIVTVVTEFYVMVASLLVLPRGALSRLGLSSLLGPVVGGAFMGGVIWLGSFTGLYGVLTLIGGLAAYVVVSLALRTFHPNEIQFAMEFVRPKNLISLFDPRRRTEPTE